MGWFSNDDLFTVDFEGVELETPVTADSDSGARVNGRLQTKRGSDDYGVKEIQIYLEGENGTTLLERKSFDQFYVGGAIDRDIPFTVEIDASRIKSLLEDGDAIEGKKYGMQSYVIAREAFTGKDRIEDHWSETQEYLQIM
ncbi:MAG: hypothetical protein SVU32_03955 [Candidatus Nanohaloarchaea archaeon]|nr:hypothetical protein [Candidatus Nanohaloarchaea archaeon]